MTQARYPFRLRGSGSSAPSELSDLNLSLRAWFQPGPWHLKVRSTPGADLRPDCLPGWRRALIRVSHSRRSLQPPAGYGKQLPWVLFPVCEITGGFLPGTVGFVPGNASRPGSLSAAPTVGFLPGSRLGEHGLSSRNRGFPSRSRRPIPWAFFPERATCALLARPQQAAECVDARVGPAGGPWKGIPDVYGRTVGFCSGTVGIFSGNRGLLLRRQPWASCPGPWASCPGPWVTSPATTGIFSGFKADGALR